MKSQYIILDGDLRYQIRGLIPDKELLEIFKSQRDMTRFTVEKTKDPNVIKILEDENRTIELAYGTVLFADEYEYMMLSFDQFFLDIESELKSLYQDLSGFLKLDDDEDKIIIQYMKMVILHVEEYRKRLEDDTGEDDEIAIEEEYFNMQKMISVII